MSGYSGMREDTSRLEYEYVEIEDPARRRLGASPPSIAPAVGHPLKTESVSVYRHIPNPTGALRGRTYAEDGLVIRGSDGGQKETANASWDDVYLNAVVPFGWREGEGSKGWKIFGWTTLPAVYGEIEVEELQARSFKTSRTTKRPLMMGVVSGDSELREGRTRTGSLSVDLTEEKRRAAGAKGELRKESQSVVHVIVNHGDDGVRPKWWEIFSWATYVAYAREI
ncbi:hypothetical protein BDN70DRAFT_899272 [Pholiota conissans]|uniref:Uncharacterized protein n=1 Tax=Pholiota conissans TaxID=109636 RepID=A0A9P6CW05_9AGAR|nr:hypothetical protein BDN70DRAFT_899272 [Pholiota conissans]